MTSKVKLKLISTIFIILLVYTASLPCALGQEQSGNKAQKPLGLTAVTLTGGGNVQDATDIPTEPRFNFQFDKNVVSSIIWENNSKCFSLVSEDNENIPVSVTKVDDTVDFSQRQNIFVQPVNPLRPGTTYYLKISPELKNKNGTALGETKAQGITIAFKTGGEAPAQPLRSATPAPPVPSAQTADAAAPSVQDSKGKQLPDTKQDQQQVTAAAPAADQKTMPDAGTQQQDSTDPLAGWLTAWGILLIGGWIALEILAKRKRKL